MKLNNILQTLTDGKEKAEEMCHKTESDHCSDTWHYWDGKKEAYRHAIILLENLNQ